MTVSGELKTHLLAYVSWFKVHPESNSFGKLVSVWYYDLFDDHTFLPVHLLVSRAVTLIDDLYDDLYGESVLFVVPCVESLSMLFQSVVVCYIIAT